MIEPYEGSVENRIFGGWIDESSSKKYMPGDRLRIPAHNVVLKAIWIDPNTPTPEPRNYTVTYMECDNEIGKKEFQAGSNITFDVPVPYRRGYYVYGWSYEGRLIDTNTLVNRNMTVHVAWKQLPLLNEENPCPSLTDVLILLQYVSGTGPLKDVPHYEMVRRGYDLNRDNKINLVDVLIYLKAV